MSRRPSAARARLAVAGVLLVAPAALACSSDSCAGAAGTSTRDAVEPQPAPRSPLPATSLVRGDAGPCSGWTTAEGTAAREPRAPDWRVRWSREDFRGPLGRQLSAKTDFLAPRIDDVQPAVTADRIYVVAGDGDGVIALSHQGELLWGHNLPEPFGADPAGHGDDNAVAAPPVATPDGGVLLATARDELLHYSADGELLWSREAAGEDLAGTAPAVRRRIALAPGGRILWAPPGEPTVRAYTRCGDLAWTLRLEPTERPRELSVGATGILFVMVGSERLYRVGRDGTAERLPLPLDAMTLDSIDGHGRIRVHGAEMAGGGWRRMVHAALDPESGAVRHRLSYRFHPQQAADRVAAALAPFGLLTYGPHRDSDGGWYGMARWIRPGRRRALRVRDPAFDLAPAGGPKVAVTLRDGGVLGIASTVEGDVSGLVVLREDGVARRVRDIATSRIALHPSGLLVLAGRRSVHAVRTPVRPAEGWSHGHANAWSSSSLAVTP